MYKIEQEDTYVLHDIIHIGRHIGHNCRIGCYVERMCLSIQFYTS